jgi:hypothetical protein
MSERITEDYVLDQIRREDRRQRRTATFMTKEAPMAMMTSRNASKTAEASRFICELWMISPRKAGRAKECRNTPSPSNRKPDLSDRRRMQAEAEPARQR